MQAIFLSERNEFRSGICFERILFYECHEEWPVRFIHQHIIIACQHQIVHRREWSYLHVLRGLYGHQAAQQQQPFEKPSLMNGEWVCSKQLVAVGFAQVLALIQDKRPYEDREEAKMPSRIEHVEFQTLFQHGVTQCLNISLHLLPSTFPRECPLLPLHLLRLRITPHVNKHRSQRQQVKQPQMRHVTK